MKYLWTEDTGAGLHFWKLVSQLFFDNELVIESKQSNQGILDALSDLTMKEEDEYYIAFDKIVAWTGVGKTDKIKIREEVLSAIENHRINLSKIKEENTLQFLAGFKRYSTERVMKSLVGEFTQNEKWSVKGSLMGECWYSQRRYKKQLDRFCSGSAVEQNNVGNGNLPHTGI
jgi:hypothetical protein